MNRDFAIGVCSGIVLTYATWKIINEFARHPDPDFTASIPHLKSPPPLHPRRTKWEKFTDTSFQLCKIIHMVLINSSSVLLCISSQAGQAFHLMDLETGDLKNLNIGVESIWKLKYFPEDDIILAQKDESNHPIYKVFLDGKKPELVTELLCDGKIAESDFTWVNGKLKAIVFVERNEEHPGWNVFDRELIDNSFDLFQYSSGDWSKVASDISHVSESLQISSNGSHCVWKCYLNHIPEEAERGSFFACNLSTNTVRLLGEGFPIGRIERIRISSDGKYALYETNFNAERPITTAQDLWLEKLDLPSKPFKITNGNSVIHDCGWSTDSSTIWFTVVKGSNLQSFSVQVGDLSNLAQHCTIEPAITGPCILEKSLYVSEDSKSFPALYRNGEIIFEPPHPKDFSQIQCHSFTFKARDGLQCMGYVFELKDLPAYAPLICHVHGGPCIPWPLLKSNGANVTGYPYRAMLFAGFRIYVPIYRGSNGFGDDFAQANISKQGFLDNDLGDILDGLQYLEDTGIVPKGTPAGIFGGSYGGYMTIRAMSLTDRFCCGVSQKSFMHNRYMTYSGGDYTWEDEYFGNVRNWDNITSETSDCWSMIAKIDKPLLFLHGADDDICCPDQAAAAYRILVQNEVPTGLVTYDGEKHGFKKPLNRQDVDRRTLNWFLDYIPTVDASGRRAKSY